MMMTGGYYPYLKSLKLRLDDNDDDDDDGNDVDGADDRRLLPCTYLKYFLNYVLKLTRMTVNDSVMIMFTKSPSQRKSFPLCYC